MVTKNEDGDKDVKATQLEYVEGQRTEQQA